MFRGDAELLQASKPTLSEDTKGKIGQLLVVIVTNLVDSPVVHPLIDRLASNLLKLP